jgi:PAS domain S-box-containing protein
MLKPLARLLLDLARRLDSEIDVGRRTADSSPRPTGKEDVEQTLRDQIQLTQSIVELLPVDLFLKDDQGRFTMVNQNWSRMSGVPAEKAIGHTVHDIYPPEMAARISAEDEKLLAQGAVATPIEAVHHGPRPEQWRIVRKAVLTRADGTVQGLISTSTDISAMKRAEADLREQIALTRALIDNNPNAIYLKDTEGRYVTVNDAWVQMLGVPRERAIGHTMADLFPEEESLLVSAAEDRRLIAEGEGSIETEALRTGPDGKPQWLIERKAVMKNTQGVVTGLIGTNTDITHLKRYEQELADRAKFISELVDALPNSVAMRDLEGRYVLVNRAWERFYGLSREQVLGRRRRELPGWESDPARLEDASEIEQSDRDMLKHGPDYIAEAEEVIRLGRTHLMTRRVLADSAGTPLGVLSAGIDVTERRATEAALAAERHRLALVVSATKAGIIDWDTGTELPWYSDRFKQMLGYPPEVDTSAWASVFGALMHPEDRDRSREVFFTGLVSQGAPNSVAIQQPFELRLRCADGSWLWVQSMGLTLHDEAGNVKRYLAAVTDITERRAQEEELRQSVRLREEVERMSRHDLKTPLNSVVAMARLLREGDRVAPEDAELLGTIERAGYRILNMVNLSLDLFRMETGAYEFEPRAVDVGEVVRRVAADLESQAASKNIDVRVRANGVSAATQEVLVRGDELLCYSMFANLVKNAIEASPVGGTVSILLSRQDDAVLACVHNPGAVPEAIRGRFFQKYATTGKSAGLGLGTYSASLMARVQEGELSLDTSEEGGTTLAVRLKPAGPELPRASESRETGGARAEAQKALPALRVLVVDDDEFNRLVLRRYLPSPPLNVAFAVNGRAALEAAERDWPDVVLLDIEMPVMDGYEAARRLRDLERERNLKRCLIVAISSNNEGAIAERALAAGCDRYIVKPAPRQVLWGLLSGADAGIAGVSGRGNETAAQAGPSDTVLVEEELRSGLPGFLASRRELLKDAQSALAAGDRVLFRRHAHRLAGSFAIYGFKWAAAQASALEADAPACDPADLEKRTAKLLGYLDEVNIEFTPASGAAESA